VLQLQSCCSDEESLEAFSEESQRILLKVFSLVCDQAMMPST
jgi:hypothetical protein